MNYRHIYHAGNFADVVKHITLIILLIKKRFAGAIIMLWYPIKNRVLVDNFYANYKKIGFTDTIGFEFAIRPMEGIAKP
ncbi:MAG: 23S rRNA (adenine(2030)-N(6))-methyltransferase RlmJ [Rickettsia endosymbiont of Bryobia graminum]|nr:23S rRNA (adenine(2030)-N(6))-methyltransferase RlmJ [Rickettsia endosymbiont of Bryobia graminum]